MSAVIRKRATPVNRILANREKRYSLAAFARLADIDRDYETILQWVNEGLLNRITGKRVKLETCFGTAGRETSLEAYGRMIEELNEG